MPCAAGELLCHFKERTTKAPEGHACRGGCGGRLHGTCGEEMEPQQEGNEPHRICFACAKTKQAATGASEAGDGKRKEPGTTECGGAGSSKRVKEDKEENNASRKRLNLGQKLEVLALLDQGVTHNEISDRYGCKPRTVRFIKTCRKELEEQAGTSRKDSTKSVRVGDFPKVDGLVLGLFEKARMAKYPVTRAVLQSFGRSATATLLQSAETTETLKEKLRQFKAGDRWAKNFVARNGLQSRVLQGEAGCVNHELIKKDAEKVREACEKFPAKNIFSVGETGIQWKILPKRTYLRVSGDRKTARGTKGMGSKDRVCAIMCCNAPGTAKVEIAVIGKAKSPRCFRRRACPVKYLSQANAWSDSATCLKWWQQVFLPFVRRWTHEPVLLLMGGCSSHADFVDDRGQVTVMLYPPIGTSVHQPMDMGIIAATKLIYRKQLLDVKVSTMLVAPTLRAQAKERNMVAGTVGLAEGHHPHVLDAAGLLKSAWGSVTPTVIARCFVKAKTLPVRLEAELTSMHVRARPDSSKDPVKGLAETLNKLSSSVKQTMQQGCRLDDTELIDLLANLDITPGEPADEAAIQAAQVWATVEEQEDVAEAMRLDAVEDMTAQLNGTYVGEGNDSEDEKEDGDGESRGRRSIAPPAYAELSSHFGLLERAAEESENGDAAFHLQKARMAMIAAHAASESV